MSDKPVRECKNAADEHLGLGQNVRGEGPDPYEPHVHPFTLSGWVACCTGNRYCRIEGHITRVDDGYQHAQAAS